MRTKMNQDRQDHGNQGGLTGEILPRASSCPQPAAPAGGCLFPEVAWYPEGTVMQMAGAANKICANGSWEPTDKSAKIYDTPRPGMCSFADIAHPAGTVMQMADGVNRMCADMSWQRTDKPASVIEREQRIARPQGEAGWVQAPAPPPALDCKFHDGEWACHPRK